MSPDRNNQTDNTAGSGQREHLRLVLEVGRTSTLQAVMQSGGSRWPDRAVSIVYLTL